jgi:hypothetical protein
VKTWDAFYDFVVPDVPGCPFAAVDVALRQAAIDFCSQSLVWKYSHPDITVAPGTASYNFAPPAQAVVHTVTYAEFEGSEIDCHTGESGIQIYNWRNQTGTPEYVLGGATSLTLVPTPDVAGTLKLEVALKPSPAATGIDDDVFNEYRDAVVHGALGRLMASPKKPYTALQLATYHQQLFTQLTGQAGYRVARSYTRAPLRTTINSRGR